MSRKMRKANHALSGSPGRRSQGWAASLGTGLRFGMVGPDVTSQEQSSRVKSATGCAFDLGVAGWHTRREFPLGNSSLSYHKRAWVSDDPGRRVASATVH